MFGRIDILINNAQGGALGIDKPTIDLSDNDVLEFFRTGPLGTLHLMQAAFPALRESDHAVVINLGSAIGVRGGSRQAAYSMAKEAIGGLTKSTAIEWGKYGIRVNVVCPAAWSPGAEAYRDQDPARWEQVQRAIPLRRFGDPYSDIGRAVVALVSDDLHYLTGATIMLDGGQVMLR
jgi:2-hydroxycyclohexanecarboxyl-CoA dehydrogenase